MLEARRASLGCVICFWPAAAARGRVVRLRPAVKLRAAAAQPLQQVDEGGVLRPECTAWRGTAPRRGALGRSTPSRRRRVLASSGCRSGRCCLPPAIWRGEDLLRGFQTVRARSVPASAGDVGGLAQAPRPGGAAHRARPRARRRRAVGAAGEGPGGMLRPLVRRRAHRARASTVVTNRLTEQPCSSRMYQ